MKSSTLRVFASSALMTALTITASISYSKTKKTVCSVTINSNDEIEAFKKGLPSDKFDFIELTSIGKDEDDRANWLRNSCKLGIQCDILVVSGHFAGSFFGSSGLKLPIEDLEAASCDQSCSGVLHNPKEVFLFGCNTLAGKNKDSRTPEQYVQVLVADGFSYEEARAVTAFRYSPLGSSFSDRMSRIFTKVPRIYGFSSIAPSGENGTPYLKSYLRKTGSTYFDYLASVSGSTNKTLSTEFRETALAQVSGKQDLNTPVCYINNEKFPNEKKLSYILSIMEKGGILELAPFMVNYFSKLDVKGLTEPEKALLQKIYNNKSSKQKLDGFIQKPVLGLIKSQVDVLNLMVTLNWYSQKEYGDAVSRLVLEPFYNSPVVTTEIKDQICSMNLTVVGIDPRRIKEKNWRNSDFYSALECMKPTNSDLMEVIVSKIPEIVKLDLLSSGVITILANAQYQTPKAIESLSSLLFLDTPPLWDLYSYVRITGTESPYLKKQLLKAVDQGKGPDAYRILLYVSRNDHAYIDPIIEDALNASSFSERFENDYTLADMMKIPSVFDKVLLATKATNPSRQISSLRLLQVNLDDVRSKALPLLVEIVKGNYPLVSKMLSLSIIAESTKNLENWKDFFKEVYRSGAHYQLRQLALRKYDGGEDELLDLLKVETDQRFKNQLISKLYSRNNRRYLAQYQGRPSSSEVNRSLLKEYKSMAMHKFDDVQNEGNFIVQTAVLGIDQNAISSDAPIYELFLYGFELQRIIIDRKSNEILAFETLIESDIRF